MRLLESNKLRLDTDEHTRHPWHISSIVEDFDLVDAWTIPVSGDAHDFPKLQRLFLETDLASTGRMTSALFIVRGWLGGRPKPSTGHNARPIPGCTETSLQERLPDDLAPATNTGQRPPFRAVFFTDREYTAEYSSGLVHAALHLGWVQEQKTDRYRGQLAVYVKHRNHYGPLYMTAIAPFRHHIVYPTILKRLGRTWDSQ